MQTIDIKTTQNVAIEYELASLRDRFFATVIDVLIVRAIYYALFFLIVSAYFSGFLDESSDWLIMLFTWLLPIVFFLLYQFCSELFADGQSWGKKAMKIKVVKVDGSESSLGDHLIRAVFYLVDLSLCIGIVGALSILSSKRKQRIGDYAANTAVVRLRSSISFELKDILNIDSIEGYEPTYPQVRQLSEQDMLLIKNTIARYQTHRNEAHRAIILQLTKRLEQLLDVPESPNPKIDFLKTLIRDYIVLTR
ncbi:MAG: RDD family protein [Bacteroidota bacterium]